MVEKKEKKHHQVKFPVSQHSPKCVLWNIPWSVSCEVDKSTRGLVESEYTLPQTRHPPARPIFCQAGFLAASPLEPLMDS